MPNWVSYNERGKIYIDILIIYLLDYITEIKCIKKVAS